ncbi:MAG: hypothetical protein HYV08_07400 [Deltaproteobacteria bacterium]|nr:hypothetical protein [Deltaproteobacteria bacterium]MBI3075846.1 hypothetical protein [Deltaproteobacteria bacterium]
MTWIRVVNEDEAQGEVKRIYDARMGGRGYVSTIVKAFSLRPPLLAAWQQFSHTVTFGGSSLGRLREEFIAVVCSAKLRCSY